MVNYLTTRGLETKKIQVIHNGANTDLFHFDAKARSAFREMLNLQNKFVVVYAGLLGIAQGLPAVVEAAGRLAALASNVHFLFIGDGPVKSALQKQAGSAGLKNITFLEAQPRDTIPGYLSAGDIALVPLTRKRLIGALPSKMFDAMACERPVLLAAKGESSLIMAESSSGLIVAPEDASALVEAIIQLRDDPELCLTYGQNGRRVVENQYSRQALAEQLVGYLERIK